MGLTRQSVVDGPGTILHGGSLLVHCQENIDGQVELDTWRPRIATHGEGGPRLRDGRGTIRFKPSGEITQDLLDFYFPAALRNPTINMSMHGTSDVATLIHSTAGKKVTFKNTALASMPELILTPQETTIGEVVLNALIANGADRTTAESLYVTADEAWSEQAVDTGIIAVPYSAAWNSLTIHTERGWRVRPELRLEPRYVDGVGTIDNKFAALTVRASCTPVNLTEAQILGALRPQGLALGANMRQGQNLVITGATGGLTVTLYDAVLMQGPCQWGPNRLRAGEIGFEASRLISGGTLAALFNVTISA